jgi:methionine aminotransferase
MWLAPAALTAEFRKVHQFNVFTVNTPMQHGLARYLADPRPTSSCRRSTSASATCSAPAWRTRLRLLPSEGSYFQCVDYSASAPRRGRVLPNG